MTSSAQILKANTTLISHPATPALCTIHVIHVFKLTNMEWKTCVRQEPAPTAQTFAGIHSAIVIVR